MEKLKTTQTDGKIYSVLGLEELILLKWPHYSRQSIDSSTIPIKIPTAVFTELEKIV